MRKPDLNFRSQGGDTSQINTRYCEYPFVIFNFMKKNIITLYLLTILISASSQTRTDWNNLIGTWTYNYGYFVYTLVINSDSTYEYSRIGDLNYDKSDGNWKLENGKLVLNSNKQKSEESKVISHLIDTITGVRLSIHDIFGEPVIMPRIKIFGNTRAIDTLMTNYNGLFEFPSIKNISSLEVSFIGLRNVKWNENLNQNFFELIMAPESRDYIYQTDEKWKIKNDRLYHPNYKKDNKILKNKNRVNYFVKIKN